MKRPRGSSQIIDKKYLPPKRTKQEWRELTKNKLRQLEEIGRQMKGTKMYGAGDE